MTGAPARWLYGALMRLLQPLARRRLSRRGKAEPGYLQAVDERFGRYGGPAPGTQAGAGWVWLHAVSLGETRTAALLLAELRARWPGMRLLLTHGTATGRAEGARLLREGDVQTWLPWDAPGAVARFLDRFAPRLGVLMETEVWPTLAAAAQARGVPLALVNARLSEKTLRQTRYLAWLARPAYGALAAVYAQTEADAARLRMLEAPVRGVFGNMKFDARPDTAQLAQGRDWRARTGRPVLLLASARGGEEALFFKEIQALAQAGKGLCTIKKIANNVQWLIVPRHPQRFDEVAALACAQGFTLSRRSDWGRAGPVPAHVWLGDSLGEMALYYGLADAALLGGSFAPLGGQNLIEAAACGCPVLMGPHTFNFAQAAQQAEQAGAARRSASLGDALRQALALLADPQALAAAHMAAAGFVAAHQGAARRTADALAGLLGDSEGGDAPPLAGDGARGAGQAAVMVKPAGPKA